MDIFSVFTLCGGLAFFLFGMHIMSSSLEKIAGGKLELTLKKLTSNPFKSLLLGAGITIAIQSSSAMTVMLVAWQLRHYGAEPDRGPDYGLQHWHHPHRLDSQHGRY